MSIFKKFHHSFFRAVDWLMIEFYTARRLSIRAIFLSFVFMFTPFFLLTAAVASPNVPIGWCAACGIIGGFFLNLFLSTMKPRHTFVYCDESDKTLIRHGSPKPWWYVFEPEGYVQYRGVFRPRNEFWFVSAWNKRHWGEE